MNLCIKVNQSQEQEQRKKVISLQLQRTGKNPILATRKDSNKHLFISSLSILIFQMTRLDLLNEGLKKQSKTFQ